MSKLTVKEYAEQERVSQRTVRRWIEKGALDVHRTKGGGIRIPDEDESNVTAKDTKRHGTK